MEKISANFDLSMYRILHVTGCQTVHNFGKDSGFLFSKMNVEITRLIFLVSRSRSGIFCYDKFSVLFLINRDVSQSFDYAKTPKGHF